MATGSSRPDPSFKPSGRSLIPAAKDLKAIEAAITSSEPLIKRVDFDDEGDDLKCPVLDYYPHVVNGGFVMNPKSIKPFPPSFEDDSFREEKGLPALGIHHRDGVLFAVNHAQPDLCDTAVTYPRLGLVATISGGKVDDCSQLLGELKTKCDRIMHEKPGDLNFAKLKELMTHTLSSRFEVGLIAGWDSTMGFPALYRVDGIGGHIRAAGILATGSEFRQLYSSLDLNHLNWLKSNYPDGKCELDEVLDRPSHYRNYLNWFTWSTHEAAKLAIRKICWTAANAEHGFDYVTMFSVGRGGAEVLFPGTPVEEYVRNCSRPARRFKHLWIDPHQKRK